MLATTIVLMGVELVAGFANSVAATGRYSSEKLDAVADWAEPWLYNGRKAPRGWLRLTLFFAVLGALLQFGHGKPWLEPVLSVSHWLRLRSLRQWARALLRPQHRNRGQGTA